MINWALFSSIHYSKEQWAFENLAYFLFCSEHNIPTGIFRYKNQAGIETEPVATTSGVLGFQAKYVKSVSSEKNDIIDSIKKAVNHYPNLTCVFLYVNEELSSKSGKPNYQIEIENAATSRNISLEWRVPSNIEFQLSLPENRWIHNLFFEDNPLSPDFFRKQVEKNVANLGPRFQQEKNVELPIASIFDILSKNEKYIKQIKKIIADWINEPIYFTHIDGTEYAGLKNDYEQLQKDVAEWSNNLALSITEPIDFDNCQERLKEYQDKTSRTLNTIIDKYDWGKCDNIYYEVRKINSSVSDFITSVDALRIDLCNNPILIIQGEAGCGKSHLMGDIASKRIESDLPTLLLLGTTFKDPSTIEQNIVTHIGLSCTFSELLDNLNQIGLRIGSRVLIMIDAINEGLGAELWRDQIAGFIAQISKYPAIALTLTIRSTYFNDIIPEHWGDFDCPTIITHKGFAGNEYEALRLFCDYYNLELPSFPILNPEYANPLFLHLLCSHIKQNHGRTFPRGFDSIESIYSSFKKDLDVRLERKNKSYKNRHIASKAIDFIAQELLSSKYEQVECSSLYAKFDKEFPLHQNLLTDLIEEGVLIKTINPYSYDHRELVMFAYQRLGDFFMADILLRQYNTFEELVQGFSTNNKLIEIKENYHWKNEGITDALSILIPEKYGVEFIELSNLFKTDNNNPGYLQRWFAENLLSNIKWRNPKSIHVDKITKWLNNNQNAYDDDQYLLMLTEVCTIPNHPFNSNRLSDILKQHTMAERDSFLQHFLYNYTGYDDNNYAYPIQRLIDWIDNGINIDSVDEETIFLAAQTLVWCLSSTKISLRDKTSKSLVRLLEHNTPILLRILTTFKDVDDLYILERLYAIAYGCALRTQKKEDVLLIGRTIFDYVFKDGNPPPHILLRDYARNTVEYAVIQGLEIDVNLIRPPYRSEFNFTPLTNEQLDDKYKPQGDSGNWYKRNWGVTAIMSSMVTNDGNRFYGDFGRYVFQNSLEYFILPEKYNVHILSNIAVEWIFEKYGYSVELHNGFDQLVGNLYGRINNRSTNHVERIGKKYQWIALYEMVARVSDNFLYLDRWCNNKTPTQYPGPWQNYLRNFDPIYLKKDPSTEDKPMVNKTDWWTVPNYDNWAVSDAKWVLSTDDLIPPESIIQKNDDNGNLWLRLCSDNNWIEPNEIRFKSNNENRKIVNYLIQSFVVKEKDKNQLLNDLKGRTLFGRWLPEYRDGSTYIFHKEKYWAPACSNDSYDEQQLWEEVDNSIVKVMVPIEIGKSRIEHEESGTNESYLMPIEAIFTGMDMRYSSNDGDMENKDGEVIFFNKDSRQCLIRQKDFLTYLHNNGLTIIWTCLGEKIADGGTFFKVPCGIYYLDGDTVKGSLTVFDRD